jgi:hypothetical protein
MFGFFTAALIFSAYLHGSETFNWIEGPTKLNRQDGILKVSGDHGNLFYAVDPVSKLSVHKNLNLTSLPDIYLDVPQNGTPFVIWKSNRLFDYDVEYHMHTNYIVPRFQPFAEYFINLFRTIFLVGLFSAGLYWFLKNVLEVPLP